MWPRGRTRTQTIELPTIWGVPDDLWAIVAAAIAATPWSIACVTRRKFGPAWAAQQAKNVSETATNGGARTSCATPNSAPLASPIEGGSRPLRLAWRRGRRNDDDLPHGAAHDHGDAPVVDGDEPAGEGLTTITPALTPPVV